MVPGQHLVTSACVCRLFPPVAVFFPAAYAAAALFSRQPGSSTQQQQRQQQRQLFILVAMLLQPAHVLIDHSHFQYNCISLGLAALAAVVIAQGQDVLGSVLFCLSLNHKQMGLFYAPAFFAHLLGRCLQRPSLADKVREKEREEKKQRAHGICMHACLCAVFGVLTGIYLCAAPAQAEDWTQLYRMLPVAALPLALLLQLG